MGQQGRRLQNRTVTGWRLDELDLGSGNGVGLVAAMVVEYHGKSTCGPLLPNSLSRYSSLPHRVQFSFTQRRPSQLHP